MWTVVDVVVVFLGLNRQCLFTIRRFSCSFYYFSVQQPEDCTFNFLHLYNDNKDILLLGCLNAFSTSFFRPHAPWTLVEMHQKLL